MNQPIQKVIPGIMRLSLVLAFILPLSGKGWLTAVPNSTAIDSISLELLAPPYRIQAGQDGFFPVQAEGYANSALPKEPVLPRKTLLLALPPQADPSSVTLEVNELLVHTLPGRYNVPVLPPDSPQDGSASLVKAWQDSDQKTSPGFVRLLSTGQMRKWLFIRLEHTPFSYEPATGQLSLASRIQLTIHFRLNPSVVDTALLSDSVLDQLAKSSFINFDQAQAWYPEIIQPEQPDLIYDYVIITTNAIESGSTNLDDFILHKNNRGFHVLVITQDEYGSLDGQPPNGTAEKIRKWLQDNYNKFGIKYVLLIGDPDPYNASPGDTVGDIPMKMCWPRLYASNYKESPTDYFYADLNGNWDKDGDGYYGEWNEDMGEGGIDFAPEVYVGRIPVYFNDYSSLDAILQKIVDYENETDPLSWRKQALLPMSFSIDGYDGAMLSEQMKDDYLDGAGFTTWTQYQQGSGACSPDSLYISNQELRGGAVVRDRWSTADYGLVLWWGHGSPTSAQVGYESCWDGTLFDNTQTAFLDDDHPAFVYQNSCSNGTPENADNLQYSLLKQGAVSTVSATRVSWFNTSTVYGYFDGSTTNSGIGYEYAKRLVAGQNASQALYNAKFSLTPEADTRLMNYYDFNLYGDPTTYLLPPTSPAAFLKTEPSDGHNSLPTALTLSWQSTTPITRFEYCYDTSDDNDCSNWINNSLHTSASLNGLSDHTTYYWQVRAWNENALPTYSDNSTWWHFHVGSENQEAGIYLPLIIRNNLPGSLENGELRKDHIVGWQEFRFKNGDPAYSMDQLVILSHFGGPATRLGSAAAE